MKEGRKPVEGPIKPGKPGGRRRAGSTLFALALLGLTLGALGHVAVQAKTVEIAILLDSERARHEELLARRRQLEILVGELKDPGRLLQEGQRRGMVATPAAVRVVPPLRRAP